MVIVVILMFISNYCGIFSLNFINIIFKQTQGKNLFKIIKKFLKKSKEFYLFRLN